MNRPDCSRLWQVEACLDGRLDPTDTASFDRHASSCADCTRELGELRALSEVMQRLPDARVSEMEKRRSRRALLQAADERMVGGERLSGAVSRLRPVSGAVQRGVWRSWRAPVFGLAAAAFLAGAVVLFRASGGAKSAGEAAVFEVRDEGAAQWTEAISDGATRVSLQEGRAGFHVEHLRGGARFVVALPDGQLEVRGTRFSVVVDRGRTREIAVSEGSVVVAVAGFSGVLEAGQRWTLEHASPAAATGGDRDRDRQGGSAGGGDTGSPTGTDEGGVAGGAGPVSEARGDRGQGGDAASSKSAAGSDNGARRSDGGAAGKSASGAATGARSGEARSAAGVRFAEAMAAFSAGDYGRADRLFAAFVREFPSDARAEDATFLRAEARARRGDKAGAEAAAQEYLKAYPKGLRRPEAAQLAPDAGAP